MFGTERSSKGGNLKMTLKKFSGRKRERERERQSFTHEE